jgi:hypothetical protein
VTSAETAPPAAYRERLWPGPVVWLLAFVSIAALAIAYGSSLGALTGWLVALGVGAVALALIARSAVTVEVTALDLRAGRATIGWQHTGKVLALDAGAARTARGPQGDQTAFMLLRPGVGPGAIVVEVTDPEDPHRTWLIASRHPEELTRAITAARGSLAP